MNLARINALKKLERPILITGHTGFKGTWLMLMLESLGIETFGFSLEPESNSLYSKIVKTNKQNEIFGDICDKSTFARALKNFMPSAIFHLAAQPLVLNSYQNPNSTFEINVMGTVNVLDFGCKTKSIKSIVCVTSDKVYTNNGEAKHFVETDPLSGKDPYSASKVGAEAAVLAWQNMSNKEMSPSVLSVRAGNVIGGGDLAANRLFPDLIRNIMEEKKLFVRNSNSTRPWQHVLDPLLGYINSLAFSLKNGSLYESYNFGPNGDSLTVDDVLKIARKNWPNQIELEYSRDVKELKIEAENLALDSSKARNDFGWQPMYTQIEAIEKTMNWWNKTLIEKISPKDATLEDITLFYKKVL